MPTINAADLILHQPPYRHLPASFKQQQSANQMQMPLLQQLLLAPLLTALLQQMAPEAR
jgi:hypothetical protein